VKTASMNSEMAYCVVGEWLALGVQDAVLSPGSRNTPLVMALSQHAMKGQVKLHTIIDERAAGFYALGLARVTGAPVLLSCTSGSAGTHYFPAIVEASKSRIPLIAMTADRPSELQDCGAPQTMNQHELYGSHVRAYAHIPAPSELGDAENATGACRSLFAAAVGHCAGPVHLNIAFRKPLWDATSVEAEPVVRNTAPLETPSSSRSEALHELIEQAGQTARGLIVWGANACGTPGRSYLESRASLSAVVRALSDLTGWPVVSDATAGIRESTAGWPGHIGTADLLLRSRRFCAQATPDLVIRLGGEPTSKVVSEWLRDTTAGKCFLIDRAGWTRDPSRTARALVQMPPTEALQHLCNALDETQPVDSTWLEHWQQGDLLAKDALSAETSSKGLWAGSIAATLNQRLPKGTLLHVASSLAIRSIVSFAPETTAGITYTANRGVNGIDGTLSTALGQASRWADGATAVLLGDVAFHHDASALAYAPKDRPFLVVVVDNRGGGIFDHLPIASAGDPFERHFITDPCIDPVAIGTAYGLQATTVHDTPGLSDAIQNALGRAGSHLIVARIDRHEDLRRHTATWGHACGLLEGIQG
jgi:2-succinyl-5-enolpyruvyl-6-hydroxy-3-cyclohexene-1-carboxylate synthase